MSNTHLPCSTIAVILFAALASATAQAASITNLGVLPGGTASFANGVSADGSAVVGTSAGPNSTRRAFRWTAAGGVQDLGASTYSEGNAISADGSAVAGKDSSDTRVFRWTYPGGLQWLTQSTPWDYWSATGISGDGAIITLTDTFAELSEPRSLAYRWTSAGGLQPLDPLPGGFQSGTSAVSANGEAITGWSDSSNGIRACRWTASGIQDLGGFQSYGIAISSDGSVIGGHGRRSYFDVDHAFRWTVKDGLQYLPSSAIKYAQSLSAMSGDGSVIAGLAVDWSEGWPNDYPFIWSQNLGVVDLRTYLQSHGVDLTGWSFGPDAVTGLSHDGSVIVGNGTYNGQQRGWTAVVPEPGSVGAMVISASLLRRRRATRKGTQAVVNALSLRRPGVLASACVALTFGCNAAHPQWVTWDVAADGNGHQYQAVPGSPFLTWTMADQLAHAQGGYLATLTSAAENDFVFSLIDAPQFWNDSINGSGPAIGGFQADGSPEPSNGWRWATDEPWAYTNWFPGQPDNGAGGPTEGSLHFCSFENGVRINTWNDIARDDDNLGGYVVERVPEPGALALVGLGLLFTDRRAGVLQHHLRAKLCRRRCTPAH